MERCNRNLLWSLLLFLVLALGPSAGRAAQTVVLTADQEVTFTPQKAFGDWTITATKINGTGTVRFCSITLPPINSLTSPGATDSITSGNTPTAYCYRTGASLVLSTVGTSSSNAVRIVFEDVERPVTALQAGRNDVAYPAGRTDPVYFSLSASSATYGQFLLASANSLSATYTLGAFLPQASGCTYSKTCTSSDAGTYNRSCAVSAAACGAPITGPLYLSLYPKTSSPTPTQNDSLVIFATLLSSLTFTDITTTSMSFPLWTPTFLKATLPSQGSSFSLSFNRTADKDAYVVRYGTDSTFCATASATVDFRNFDSVLVYEETYCTIPTTTTVYFSVTPYKPYDITKSETTASFKTDHQPSATLTTLSATNDVPSGSVLAYQLPVTQPNNQSYFLVEVTSSKAVDAVFYFSYISPQCQDRGLTCSCSSAPCHCIFRKPLCQWSALSSSYYLTVDNAASPSGDLNFTYSYVDTLAGSPPGLLSSPLTATYTVKPSERAVLPYQSLPFSTITITSASRLSYTSSFQGACQSPSQRNTYTDTLLCGTGQVHAYNGNTKDANITVVVAPLPARNLSPSSPVNVTSVTPSSSLVFSLTVPAEKNSVTFSYFSLSGQLRPTVEIYATAKCASPLLRISSFSYTTSRLVPGEYFGVVSTTRTTSNLVNETLYVSFESVTCRNVSSELNFCAGFVDVASKYQNIDVPTREAYAQNDYLELLTVWPACNQSLLAYACESNFRLSRCQANGQTLSPLCSADCISRLNSQCGATLCANSVCSSVSNHFSGCRVTPPSGSTPSGSVRFLWDMSVLSFVALVALLLK